MDIVCTTCKRIISNADQLARSGKVRCPSCAATIPLSDQNSSRTPASQSVQTLPGSTLAGRNDSIIAWSIAAAIHLVVIIIVSGLGILNRPATGNDQESVIIDMEVSETRLEEPSTDTTASSDIIEVPGPAVPDVQDVAVPQVAQPTERLIATPGLGGRPMQAATSPLEQRTRGNRTPAYSQSSASDFFGLSLSGGSFVYVIDRSGSMKGDKLERVKRELRNSIQRLPVTSTFFVYFFSTRYKAIDTTEQLIPAEYTNKQNYTARINNITASGGTKPEQALSRAIQLQPDVILFLSDGHFAPTVVDDVRQEIQSTGKDIVVHTFGFGSDADEETLKMMATQHRGRYVYVKD